MKINFLELTGFKSKITPFKRNLWTPLFFFMKVCGNFSFWVLEKKGHCVSRFDTFWHIKNESGNSDPHFMASSGKWQMTSSLFYIITCMEMSFCALTLNTISVFTIWTSKYLLFSNNLLSFLFLGKHKSTSFYGVQLLNKWLKEKIDMRTEYKISVDRQWGCRKANNPQRILHLEQLCGENGLFTYN